MSVTLRIPNRTAQGKASRRFNAGTAGSGRETRWTLLHAINPARVTAFLTRGGVQGPVPRRQVLHQAPAEEEEEEGGARLPKQERQIYGSTVRLKP